MKAIILNQTGMADQLKTIEIDTPTPKKGEVLIQTKAISINPVDYKVRAIEPVLDMIVGKTSDVILGRDIAGVIHAVGEGVTEFKQGDRVFGMINFPGEAKGYAEYVVAPTDHITKTPDQTTDNEAAATTLAALTALQALQSNAKAGNKVLIHAGSGGVGHFAIQIAKSLGAHVITTCSSKNADFVRSLGADEHIDYTSTVLQDVVTDADFILDSLGGDNLVNSLKAVKDGGKIISLPSPQFPEGVLEEAQKRSISVSFFLVASNKKDMETLAGMLENKTLVPHVSQVFSFDRMGEAHTAIETGRTVGKIVVVV